MERARPMTVAEAAETIGVSGDTVRRWSDLGLLPGYRLPSGHRRFDPHEIRRFRDHMRWGNPRGVLWTAETDGRGPAR